MKMNGEVITKKGMELAQSGMDTATNYFHHAISIIDEKFGNGYAKAHPELIGEFMRTSAQDYDSSLKVQAVQDATKQICNKLDTIACMLAENKSH